MLRSMTTHPIHTRKELTMEDATKAVHEMSSDVARWSLDLQDRQNPTELEVWHLLDIIDRAHEITSYRAQLVALVRLQTEMNER